MPIESHIPETEINIKDFNLEKPQVDEEGRPFDPERDLGVGTWADMKEILEEYKLEVKNGEAENNNMVRDTAVSMKILFPEREWELGLTEMLWDNLKHEMKELVKEDKWDELAEQVAYMKILYPEKMPKEGPSLIALFRTIKDSYKDIPETNVAQQGYLFYHMKILYPGREAEFGMDEAFKMRLQNAIVDSLQKQQWHEYSIYAMIYKFLFPEDSASLHLNGEVWKAMKKHLYDSYSTKIDMWMGKNMKILAAQEINVTEKGLELVMPPTEKMESRPTPSLPEVKKF